MNFIKRNRHVIVVLLFVLVSMIYTNRFHIFRGFYTVQKYVATITTDTIIPNSDVAEMRLTGGAFFTHNLTYYTITDGFVEGEVKSTYFLNTPLGTRSDNDYQTINFNYPLADAEVVQETDYNGNDEYVSYLSFNDFYDIDQLLSIIGTNEGIIWFAVDCPTTYSFFMEGEQDMDYKMLGFSGTMYGYIWDAQHVITKIDQYTDSIKIDEKILKIQESDDYLALNFYKNLDFLVEHINSNGVLKREQFIKDVDHIKQNGIKIYGVVVKDNDQLINKLQKAGIVRTVRIVNQNRR